MSKRKDVTYPSNENIVLKLLCGEIGEASDKIGDYAVLSTQEVLTKTGPTDIEQYGFTEKWKKTNSPIK